MKWRCLFGHTWNGCTCKNCGEKRNTGHVWEGCECIICGTYRKIFDWNEVVTITSQSVLEKIISTNQSYKVKEAANGRLDYLKASEILKITNDSELIAAIKEETSGVCRSVIERLTNQAVLSDIAKNHKHACARLEAAESLTDKSLSQNMLARIVRDDQVHDLYRGRAYERITDQIVLQAISNVPFVKQFISEQAHIKNLADIEKNKQERIKNCKDHEWEGYNGGHYQGRVCKKCGLSEITKHYT